MPFKKGLHTLLKRGQDVSVIDEHFMENHPDAIFTLDPTGRVTRLNDKTSSLLGYTGQDLMNHFSFFVHPEDQETTTATFPKSHVREQRDLRDPRPPRQRTVS